MGLGQLTERIESIDIDAAGVGELSSALRDLNRVDGWVAVTKAAITRRLTELEANGGAPPAVDVLARSGRTSQHQAERATRRAAALGDVPAMGRQRVAGRISDEHVDALANAAGKLDDGQRVELFACGEELAVHAAASTPARFAAHLRKLGDAISSDDDATARSERQRGLATLAHGINSDTGMGWVRADLHPDDYQKFKRKIGAEVTALGTRSAFAGQRYDQVAAAAFMGLVTSTRAAAKPVSEVGVLVDLITLRTGTHAGSVCEYTDGSPLPVATARRYACDADIIPIVLGGDGQPLDVGRAKRHATPAQRSALRSMYRTCAVDGCDASFDRCEMHHLAGWEAHHGPTDLGNLLPVCTYHHHRAHEGRWRLQLDASTRQLSVFLPNGSLHSRCLPDMIGDLDAAA